MVGLARRLEGKPFHLVATHAQDISSRKEVVAFARANGFAGSSPNMTITKNGRHPDLEGTGFMPYYMVFDHAGKLRHHHMGGSYHGGDQLAMVAWVDKLLKDAPAVWLGAEAYDVHAKLAAKLASGKGLAASLKKLDGLRAAADAEGRAELDRLHAAMVAWRDRQLSDVAVREASAPSEVVSSLKGLQKEVKGSSLGGPVDAALAAATGSKELAAAARVEKAFRKVVKALERVKEDKRTDALVERTIEKLDALLEEVGDAPFRQTIEDYLATLR